MSPPHLGNIRPTNFYTQSDLIDFVGVFKTEQYNVYQPLANKPDSSSKQTIEVFLSLESFLFGCLLLYFASFLIGCLILFSTNNGERRGRLVTKCFNTLLGFRQSACRQPNPIGILVASFVLFQFLVQNIILNSMSSTSVVVDSSFLITSIERMFERNRKVCFGEGGPETGFFEFAPKNTIPYRIFSQLGFADNPCYLLNKGNFNFMPFPPGTFFGLIYYTTARIIKNLMHASTHRNAFLYERSFFEILRTIGIRKNLPDHLRANIDQW